MSDRNNESIRNGPGLIQKNLDDLRWGKKQEETKMISQTLVEIERSISSLSIEEQLWLLVRVSQSYSLFTAESR